MELWAVIYCDGEYEEYTEWVEAIMSTEEKAKNYKPAGLCIGTFKRIEHFILDEPTNWQRL